MTEENGITNNRRRGFEPSCWVKRFASLIPQGPVLDLACGRGRNGRYLMGMGHDVTFVDRDVRGISDLKTEQGATVKEYDLEKGNPWPFEKGRFSGIVVVNYLHRSLFPLLTASLKTEGLLIYCTFAAGNEKHGKPRNPDFLLDEDELLQAFESTMTVIEFEQGFKTDPDRVIQRICARKLADEARGFGKALDSKRLGL